MKKSKILVLVILAFLTSCGDSNSESDAWGNFETIETIISAQAQGELLMLDIDQGQTIEKDIMIGLIDTVQYALERSQLLARKQSIRARLTDIDANISVQQAQMANLERELERTGRLLKDQAATQQQYDDLKGKLDVAEKQVQAARVSKNAVHAELQAMDVQIAAAEEKLNNCQIINPVNGTVLEKYVEPHEMITPGRPVYKIADLSVMELRAYVSGSQLPHIKYGQKVSVLIDDDKQTNREMEGTISWISSRSEFTPKTIQTKEERVSQVYAIKISVPNDGSIKIGMPGEVVF